MATILIIDDEAPIRLLLRAALEDEGYNVLDAATGTLGLAVHEESQVDAVMVDMIMPEMTGIEVVARLRKSKRQSKIIAMSGGGRTHNYDFLAIAKKYGCDRTLRKPLDLDVVIETLREILSA